MSLFTNYIRGFNEDRFWRYYQKSHSRNKLTRLLYSVLYMRMATKQGGYVGRETIFLGKPHFPHGMHGIHISRMAKIGKGAIIFQNVTIGQNAGKGACIGDNVMCGSNAVVVGAVNIGNNVKIGAGAIVVDDVPDNCTVVSPKARIIRKEEKEWL